MTIATVYVADERIQFQRPDHLHREFISETDARMWIDLVQLTTGSIIFELAESKGSFRCKRCGWTAP